MATFTLDDLRAAADKKYAPTVIEAGDETFVLPSILRMDSKGRKDITKLLERAESLMDDEETLGSIDEEIKLFSELLEKAEQGGKGKRLLELIGGDAAVLIDVVTSWLKDSQAGEA